MNEMDKKKKGLEEDIEGDLPPTGLPPNHLDSDRITPQMGRAHRAIRIVSGLALFWLAIYALKNVVAIWLITILAICLLVTGLIGVCPLCRLFKRR